MVKRTFCYLLFFMPLFFLSCNQEEKVTPDPGNNEVIPKENGTIQLDDNIYYLSSDVQELSVKVKSNYDFDVVISDDAKDWIELLEANATKAVTEKTIVFAIKKNEKYNPRKAQIILSMPSYDSSDTIFIVQDEGFESIRKILRKDENCSIFYQALKLTGLEDSIIAYLDYSYPSVGYDSTYDYILNTGDCPHKYEIDYEAGGNADHIVWPDKREYKFTVFVEPDKVFNDNGITTIDELRQKAELWYPEYPNLVDDPTNRNNSLNRFVSYHILPCLLTYDQFNVSQKEIIGRRLLLSELDVEDYYETLLSHSIMRISTPYSSDNKDNPIGVFINRKGTIKTGLDIPGIKIASTSEYEENNVSSNGIYHYIDNVLLYDDVTRTQVLNNRIRVMCSTLSPDFINSGGRGRLNGDSKNAGNRIINKLTYAYKQKYCKNVLWSDNTEFYVRYRDASFGLYLGDGISVLGDFDIAFKLPPVPYDGEYEIRVFNNSLSRSGISARGVVQFYFYQRNADNDFDESNWSNWDWAAKGAPVNLRIGGDDASIGMVRDDDEMYDSMTDSQKEEAIYQNNLYLRTHGYMKAPDSYTSNQSNDNSGDPMSLNTDCYRVIICSEFMHADKDCYIRIKKTDNDPNSNCLLNFIEIVPTTVYSGTEREDRL